jgi:hypothetical protein
MDAQAFVAAILERLGQPRQECRAPRLPTGFRTQARAKSILDRNPQIGFHETMIAERLAKITPARHRAHSSG